MNIFFMHIPKTAGTSFRHLLESQFEDCEIFPDQCMIHRNNGLYPHPKQFLPYLNSLHNPEKYIKLFRGHYHHDIGNYVFKNKAKNYIGIAMLRNPVERYISHLKHYLLHNRKSTKNIQDEILKGINEEKYIIIEDLQVKFFRGNFKLEDIMSDKYYGMDVPSQTVPIDDDDLLMAKKKLDKFGIIGITEEFSASVKRIFKAMNWKPPKLMPKLNQSTVEGLDLPHNAIRAIENKVKYDIRLYDYALYKFHNFSEI